MTLRSDYLGEDRSGYARKSYPALSHFGEPSHQGGKIVGGDPLGLVAVIVEYTNGFHEQMFIEAKSDGDGVIADLIADNSLATLKVRYKKAGSSAWVATIDLDNIVIDQPNSIVRWTSDKFDDSLTDPPLGTHLNLGSGEVTSSLWEFEILDGDGEILLVGNDAYWDAVDSTLIHEEISDLWKRILAEISAEIGRKVVDVTGLGSTPTLNEETYKALFVDWSIPRGWSGFKHNNVGTDGSGTWSDWTHTNYRQERPIDPATPLETSSTTTPPTIIGEKHSSNRQDPSLPTTGRTPTSKPLLMTRFGLVNSTPTRMQRITLGISTTPKPI